MSNTHQIERLFTEITILSKLGRALSDNTSEKAGDIAVLFDVIEEKAGRLETLVSESKR